jgi:hypothetical protein
LRHVADEAGVVSHGICPACSKTFLAAAGLQSRDDRALTTPGHIDPTDAQGIEALSKM